ncbi:MAG: undecaprenyldiphospho-muramoylpentapeptide beta-N-acetylglucosaminyltransferase [Rhodospirillaceae bacterium]|nr:MAG: undecaprenyldiphospho-muramoylpentapeptide beta-N-acetylglucosaminyltransferase [Rhodospirillaceae bacterium]
MTSQLILLAAGGTGGHVFPAEALASELLDRGFRLGLVTDKRGQAYGGALGDLTTYHIQAGGIAGKSIFARIKSVVALGIGTWQAWRLLKGLKPDVVVGFGGYASVPTMMAATFASIPTIIHEQNALLGRANRLLAGRVNGIATSFTDTQGLDAANKDKVELTGMPVRAPIAAKSTAPFPNAEGDSALGILVLGGSQGATVLSEVIPAALDKLPDVLKARLDITQQCREEDLASVKAAYQKSGIRAHLGTFIDDVPERMAKAHLMISRAGASSVSEALAVGRPSILVPYPFAADDHQTYNARAVDAAGAGWIMPQNTFNADALAARLDSLLGLPAVLEKAARCASTLGRGDAAKCLADMVVKLSTSQRGTEQ